ncbi:MAG: hypothetical protein IPK39_14955 [Sulfuritalea sp.]|nr:hypothetical protein [Sulfuritalea sp.]
MLFIVLRTLAMLAGSGRAKPMVVLPAEGMFEQSDQLVGCTGGKAQIT